MRALRLTAAIILLPVPSLCSTAQANRPQRLGDVHFPISCRKNVQAQFDSGVALLHSFEFPEAEEAFRTVERDDPRCVIAAWGVALATTERSGANASQKELAAGWKELQPWLSVQAATEREQMYVDAVHAMYQDFATRSAQDRWRDYLAKMENIRQKYPDDVNASLFYGLGLVWTAGAGEKGLKQREQALAIFLPIFRKYPDNPGAAHYIIHAADTASLASQALPAARTYASIAPDSPHALHMPSHIFNRLGYWKESIRANQASARVAARWIEDGRDGVFDELHALNNIEYGYLQLGRDAEAKQVVSDIASVSRAGKDPWPPIDGRVYYDLETHGWSDALQIEPPSSSKFEENFDVYWIKCIAAARSDHPKQAREELEQYRKSSSDWESGHGWGDILNFALTEAEAWTLHSEGKNDQAVAKLRAGELYEKDHPMYYADILPRPAGEMLGDLLLSIGRPNEALIAYEEALELAPKRLDSLIGATIAANRIGNSALALHFQGMVKNEGGEIVQRP